MIIKLISTLIVVAFAIVTSYYVWKKCKEAWIKGEALYGETKSQQVLTAIPGTCTAWGILFTFGSIVVTLIALLIVGDSSNFTIFKIVGYIIPAFITSVIGMWYSIKYSQKVTEIIGKEEKEEMAASGNPMLHFKNMAEDVRMMRHNNITKDELTTLITAINNIISQVCDRLDSQDQKLGIIDQYIRNQDNILETFAKTFSDRLNQYFESSHEDFEKQMKEHMTAEMSRSMDVLQLANQQLTENVKSLTSDHKAALERVVSDMNSSISETTSSITTSMENTIQQLIKLTKDVQEATMQPLKTLNEETEFISNRVGQICTMYQQAQQGYTDTIMNIHDQNEQWEKALIQGNESLLSIKATQNNIHQLVTEISEQNEMLNRLRSGFNDIQKTIEQLQTMNSLLTKITSRL